MKATTAIKVDLKYATSFLAVESAVDKLKKAFGTAWFRVL